MLVDAGDVILLCRCLSTRDPARAAVEGHRVQKVYTYTIYAFKLKKIPGTW